MAVSETTVALIMAGGSGTRFWPLSRTDKPKQYLNLLGDRSLIQQTIDRIGPLVAPNRVFVCSAENQRHWLAEQLPPEVGTILEPAARNTAPCLMLSTAHLLRQGFSPDTAMIVLPADHTIGRPDLFREHLQEAVTAARDRGALVLLGIVPDQPHTGYGYIESGETVLGNARAVRRFVEKPDRDRAAQFLQNPAFLWNSGIFVWTLGTIAAAFESFLGAEWRKLTAEGAERDLNRVYPTLPSTPIDIAVLEKARNTLVIPVEIGWSDIGSWDALYQLRAPTAGAHVTMQGQLKSIDSEGCLVLAPGKKIALIGVTDLIVVEDGDTLLIAARSQDQCVRQAAQEFDPPVPPKTR